MSLELTLTPTQHELSPSTTEFFRRLGSYANAIAVKGYETEAPRDPEGRMHYLHHATVNTATHIPRSDCLYVRVTTATGQELLATTRTELGRYLGPGDETVIEDSPLSGQSKAPRYSLVTALTTH